MRRPVWNGLVQRNNVILWYSIACVWVVVFFIYKQSAIVTDGISGGDSAELVLTGMQGGSPHPPGYPLIGLWIHFGYHFLLRLDIVHNFEQFLHYTALGIGASAASLYALFLCRFVDTILGGWYVEQNSPLLLGSTKKRLNFNACTVWGVCCSCCRNKCGGIRFISKFLDSIIFSSPF